MERGGSLVDSSSLVRTVMGSNPALAATQGPWASPSQAGRLWRFFVLCMERLSHSGLEEAL